MISSIGQNLGRVRALFGDKWLEKLFRRLGSPLSEYNYTQFYFFLVWNMAIFIDNIIIKVASFFIPNFL